MGSQGKNESAAFHVRSSDKKDEANCSIKKLKSEDGDYPSIIECTVIYNTKKIAAGDELVLYREKKRRLRNTRRSSFASIMQSLPPRS